MRLPLGALENELHVAARLPADPVEVADERVEERRVVLDLEGDLREAPDHGERLRLDLRGRVAAAPAAAGLGLREVDAQTQLEELDVLRERVVVDLDALQDLREAAQQAHGERAVRLRRLREELRAQDLDERAVDLVDLLRLEQAELRVHVHADALDDVREDGVALRGRALQQPVERQHVGLLEGDEQPAHAPVQLVLLAPRVLARELLVLDLVGAVLLRVLVVAPGVARQLVEDRERDELGDRVRLRRVRAREHVLAALLQLDVVLADVAVERRKPLAHELQQRALFLAVAQHELAPLRRVETLAPREHGLEDIVNQRLVLQVLRLARTAPHFLIRGKGNRLEGRTRRARRTRRVRRGRRTRRARRRDDRTGSTLQRANRMGMLPARSGGQARGRGSSE